MAGGCNPDKPPPPLGSSSAARALGILADLAQGDGPHHVQDMVRRLGIPRSTAYHILRPLRDRGYVTRVGPGLFRPGPKLLELYLARAAGEAVTRPAGPAPMRGAISADRYVAGVSRSYLWNPGLTEFFDCARFRKRPPYRIGVSNASLTNHWRVALMHGIEHAARCKGEQIAQLFVANASDDPLRQIADIRRLVAAGIDILLVSCCEAQALDAVTGEVFAAGIPVVAVDRRPQTEDHYITHVAGMDTSIGRITAQWIVEKLGGLGRIVMLAGTRGASPAEQRLRAAGEVFRQHGGIDVVRSAYTNWRPEQGHAVVREALALHGRRIDAVWCDSGLQGVGSIRAFLDAGFTPGNIPPHTGGDLNQMYQLAVSNRVPLAAMDYPPAVGIRAVHALFEVLEGRAVPRRIEVESRLVIARGHETPSIRADCFVEDWVDWNAPPHSIRGHGLGKGYDPMALPAADAW